MADGDDNSAVGMICAMCEQAPATTTWGVPVCFPCAEWLSGLRGALEEMERDDPALAELGRRIEKRGRK